MEKLRLVSVVAVFFAFVSSMLMFVVGAYKSIKAVRVFVFREPLTADPSPPVHLDFTDQTMIAVVESMDAFLVAMVLLIFAGGIYNLFSEIPAQFIRGS